MARDKYQVIYDTLKNPDNNLSINVMCKLAKVSRSGYYKWLSTVAIRDRREEQDRLDFEKIKGAHRLCPKRKGIISIHKSLLDMGILMNNKKIKRLCRKFGFSTGECNPNLSRNSLST